MLEYKRSRGDVLEAGIHVTCGTITRDQRRVTGEALEEEGRVSDENDHSSIKLKSEDLSLI